MNIKPDVLTHRRKPRFRLPPGSCDAHCHVFGPAAKFPYAPNRRYTPTDAPKEMLAALHAHLGIDRAVIEHCLRTLEAIGTAANYCRTCWRN